MTNPQPQLPPGIFIHARAALAAFTQYFSARLKLLAHESKDASLHFALAAALAAAALFVTILGYVFLLVSIVFAIAAAFRNPHAWIWIMAGAALVHFAAAGALAFIAWRRLSLPVFSQTLAEFQLDTAWLHHLTKKP